jgi:hypothetical protein
MMIVTGRGCLGKSSHEARQERTLHIPHGCTCSFFTPFDDMNYPKNTHASALDVS